MVKPQVRIRRRPMAEINVVPYIDVMLVLLVIFMITAPLLTQGVKVDLPRAAAEPVQTPDGKIIVVTVKGDGSYYLNLSSNPDQALELDTAVARVAALIRLNPAIPVNVGGDRNASYGKVVQLMAALKKVGVEKVGFLTDPPERK
jgi:biopolymer transport protein TolR